jgi:hypothetical protein
MNPETLSALTSLALKLGTTTEHLWGVLVSQAPISSTVGTVLLLLWFAACVYAVKRSAAVNQNDDMKIPAVMGAGVFALLFFITFVSSVSNIAAGFFNPEYWALHEVLSSIKH